MSIKQRIFSLAERHANVVSLFPDFLRVGPGYLSAVREIRRAESLSPALMEQRVFHRLRAIVGHAWANVPFYRDFYAAHGFSPEMLRRKEDWRRVPVVTKQDLQKASLEHRCTPGREGMNANTGGTSGAPLNFLLERSALPIEWAHMHAIWKTHGYHSSHLKLRIGGAYIAEDIPFSYHPRHNEFVVNANHPLPQVVAAVLALPARHKVRWIHGYPSLVAEFAQALAGYGGDQAEIFRSQLYGVLLGSEFPAPVYREPISRLLSSNMVSWYGHSEMALLARETGVGIYQSFATYGFAEAVPTEDGAHHRLVSSSLHNLSHPFIRYDTGDLIEPVSNVGASLAFRIKQGRIGDFVTDRGGRRLALTSIIFGRHHPAFDEVQHLQVRQDMPGRITLLVVPRSVPFDIQVLRSGFDFSGLDLDWHLEAVPEPVRSKLGKIRLKVEG
jgi:phenylacetate-CoA ligase